MHAPRKLLGFARRVLGALRRRAARTRTRISLSTVPALPGPGGITLFFLPEAGVESYFVGVCVLARTLRERGHRVLLVRCVELFRRCSLKDMLRLRPDAPASAHRRTCLDCATSSRKLARAYGLECVDLRSLGPEDVRTRIREVIDRAPADLRELEVEGLPFGRLCMANLSLSWKVSEYDSVAPERRALWLQYIESALMAYFLVETAIHRLGVERLVHFNDYPSALAARFAAKKRGVPAFSLTYASHRNIDRRHYQIDAEPWYSGLARVEETWPRWRGLALPASLVDEIGLDLLSRFEGRGSHQFSPSRSGQDARSAFGVLPDRKLLVAFTSSLDERVASASVRAFLGVPDNPGPHPFVDQIEWLHALCDRASKGDDYALVVRVHPREGATKGDATRSEHLARLRAAFGADRPNVRFVWPEDPVSSYDLAEAADLALTSWSTMGLELSRLGVPVLAAWRITPFPGAEGFIEWAPTRDAWLEKLAAIVARPASLDRIASAFRWYHRYVLASSLDLRDLVPATDHEGLPRWRSPSAAAALDDVVMGRRTTAEINRERIAAVQREDAGPLERRALERTLRRIAHVLTLGREPGEDFELVQGPLADTRPSRHGIEVSGPRIRWTTAGRTIERTSPLVARLVPIIAGPPAVEARRTGAATEHTN